MEEEGNIDCWGDFVADITRQFGRNPYDVPTGRLSKLQQDTMSTAEYQQKFKNLATKAHGVSKAALKEMFITGLTPVVQEKILLAKPKDINDAFSMANMCCEFQNQKLKSKVKWSNYENKAYIPPPHKRPDSILSSIPNIRK